MNDRTQELNLIYYIEEVVVTNRLGNYQKADEDLKYSLKINPDDAYVLNYLAYSWLERDYKIDEAMEMLEKAYALKK